MENTNYFAIYLLEFTLGTQTTFLSFVFMLTLIIRTTLAFCQSNKWTHSQHNQAGREPYRKVLTRFMEIFTDGEGRHDITFDVVDSSMN